MCGRQRNDSRNDRRSVQETESRNYRVERTPLALVIAIGASQNFGAESLRVRTTGQEMAMVPMRCEEIVVGPQAA